jgi:SPX domain protein involved in polyphosphate accumulation
VKSAFSKATLVAMGIPLGVILAIFAENYFSLTFDPMISLGELVNAFATVFAALAVTVLVTYYLERHNQTNRKEKDLLMKQLDLIAQLVQEFEYSNETGTLTKIIASHKKLSTTYSLFSKILCEFKYPEKILIESNLEELIRDVRKLATDTPIRSIEKHAKCSTCSASVKNGIIALTTERKDLLEGKINEIKSKILKTQLTVNRI